MKKSVVVVLIVVVVIAAVAGVLLLRNRARQAAAAYREARVIYAMEYTQKYFANMEAEILADAKLLAESQRLSSYLRDWNNENNSETRSNMLEYLSNQQVIPEATAITIFDSEGYVVLCTLPMREDGDSEIPVVEAGLLGEEFSFYTFVPFILPLGVAAVVPIRADAEIIGVKKVVIDLSTNEFVDNFAEKLNAEFAIAAGSLVAATTVLNHNGERTIGMIIQPHIGHAVIMRGETVITEIDILNEAQTAVLHTAVYFPIHEWNGSPTGMVFIGVN
ncbi:MAG: cache domain-containing protein [Defluviitaleaceae bacterium]|nr:cache domain-containing protein [Defluviitaleaceae bacterium]